MKTPRPAAGLRLQDDVRRKIRAAQRRGRSGQRQDADSFGRPFDDTAFALVLDDEPVGDQLVERLGARSAAPDGTAGKRSCSDGSKSPGRNSPDAICPRNVSYICLYAANCPNNFSELIAPHADEPAYRSTGYCDRATVRTARRAVQK